MVLGRQVHSSNGVSGIPLRISGFSRGGDPQSLSTLVSTQEQDGGLVFPVSFDRGDKAMHVEDIGKTLRWHSEVVKILRPLICSILILISLSYSVFAFLATPGQPELLSSRTLASCASNLSWSLLEVFQVSPPMLSPANATCKQTLMVHPFAFSYGHPYVGE